MRFYLLEKHKRFYNFIIDSILFALLYFILLIALMFVLVLTGDETKIELIEIIAYPFCYFSYYFFFECLTGRTPGKMFSKSIVIQSNGEKPTIRQIASRSILRLFPLDGLSFLLGSNIGIHDLLSQTRVVEVPKEVNNPKLFK